MFDPTEVRRSIVILSIAVLASVADASSCCCSVGHGAIDRDTCANDDDLIAKGAGWREAAQGGACCRARYKSSGVGGHELEPGDCDQSVLGAIVGSKASFSTPIGEITSQQGWYSDETCEKLCTREKDCNGKGEVAVSADGEHCECYCDTDTIGEQCGHTCNRESDCSGHGSSSAVDGQCVCACDEGYIGANCEHKCNRVEDCSGNGDATAHDGICECTCDKEYGDSTCSSRCNGKDHCNGHGVAVSDGKSCGCTCEETKWSAAQASKMISFMDAGLKEPEKAGYVGATCDHLCAPEDCNGLGIARAVNGTCQCTCKEHVTGAQCGQCAEGYGGWPKCRPLCTEKDIKCTNGKPAGFKGGTCTCECNPGWDPAASCLHVLHKECAKYGTFTTNCNVPRCKKECCYFPQKHSVSMGTHVPNEPVIVYGLCNGPDGSDGSQRPTDLHGAGAAGVKGPTCAMREKRMEFFSQLVRYPCGGYFENFVNI